MIPPDVDINKLDIGEKVELVHKSDGLLIDLLKGCTMEFSLEFSDLRLLGHIPNMTIYGSLWAENCINLKYVQGVWVNGDLALSNNLHLCNISDIHTGEDLYIEDCVNLKELPENLYIGGNLYTEGSGIQVIPDDIVKGAIFEQSGYSKFIRTYVGRRNK